jgi:hypothetical protein
MIKPDLKEAAITKVPRSALAEETKRRSAASLCGNLYALMVAEHAELDELLTKAACETVQAARKLTSASENGCSGTFESRKEFSFQWQNVSGERPCRLRHGCAWITVRSQRC